MTKSHRLHSILRSNPVGLTVNILAVYVCYFICRLLFLAENWNLYAEALTPGLLWRMLSGGCLFDTSAIFYTNSIVILLYLLPWHKKETRAYWLTTKWIYIVVNSACILLNLVDCVFFEFRKHRTTSAVFREFGGEDNLAGIFASELAAHWYLVLAFIAMVAFLWWAYRMPGTPTKPLRRYYLTQAITLAIAAPVAIMCMRGNTFFLSATRPIAVSYAHKYVDEPIQTGVVLNTPFAIIRTLNRMPQPTPVFFATAAELDAVYTPLHVPADSVVPNGKNIVILIVESFAQEFVGALNTHLDGGTYKGYTPFTDSLLSVSTYYDQSFANAAFSIDAPPAVVSAIPRMDAPFMVSPHSLNTVSSIAGEARNIGYSTAFFHGADNESLGIHAFVRSVGFEDYYGRTEFEADTRFGGAAEFDGKWGIWDEPFLQFFAAKIGEMKQPFVATVFTLSSHHPFKVPEKYADVFVDEGKFPLHKCVRYADYSLRRFFETASRQPWFENTIFVLTADHASSKRTHEEYFGEVGGFRIPILFYEPGGNLPVGRQEGIVQQTDIMPTLLNHIGYNRPYIAFGKDMFNTPADSTWAFNWDFFPQYFKGDYVMRTDGANTVTEVYNYRTDPLLKDNLKGRFDGENQMQKEMNAFIQSYMQRMAADSVTVRTTPSPHP